MVAPKEAESSCIPVQLTASLDFALFPMLASPVRRRQPTAAISSEPIPKQISAFANHAEALQYVHVPMHTNKLCGVFLLGRIVA